VKLNRQPDAAEFALKAAHAVHDALQLLTTAREWAVCAGARPARKGIAAAAVKLEGWERKLREAVDDTKASLPAKPDQQEKGTG
jgi:hypothetical protein